MNRHARRRRLRGVLAFLLCIVTATGCASIPSESDPEVIPRENAGAPTQEVPEPAEGLDPLTVVREYVRASSQPASDHAAARAYLSGTARRAWQPEQGLTVIEDTFATVYADSVDHSGAPEERVVNVRGTTMGRLGPDRAFIPSNEPVVVPLRVRLQPNGEWRIVDPPTNVLITQADFNEAYFGVPVQFLAPDSNAMVPDLRYVVAKPQAGLPARVMDLLVAGPSNGLSGAVRNLLAQPVQLDSNVTGTDDGAVVVPLTGVEELSVQDKELIAAQVVSSLQHVTTSRIRLLSDGSALVPGHPDWRPSDLPNYEAITSPDAKLPGLMTYEGRVRSLGSFSPIPGPAGSGAYEVESAAQSIRGGQLAAVERVASNEVRLRVGDYGSQDQVVDLPALSMTRPSWRPARSTNGKSGELWTAVNGRRVVRVQRAPSGEWTAASVNASEITSVGRITGLRLSRDGARVAAIAGGKLVVAAVVRSPDTSSVSLRAPRILRGGQLTNVIDVDWLSQDRLVVATASEVVPVANVSVDGLELDPYNSSNLTPPMRAITAAPSMPIVVADANGLWTASVVGDVWRQHTHSRSGAEPFYPG